VVSTGLVVAVAGLVWILGSRHSARIDRLVAQLPAGPFSGPAS
jgi:Flp pilus assembly protein TadB